MKISEKNPMSLSRLVDGPEITLDEALQRARRLVSNKVGIISEIDFVELGPEEPAVFWARSRPANLSAICGQSALNFGNAASAEPDRAIMKAAGESIERYCSAQYEKEEFSLAAYEELENHAVPPQNFSLFSEKQYAQPGFPFSPLNSSTPVRWVKGYSISADHPILVPASFIYVPYEFDKPEEHFTHYPISTGLACAPNFAGAVYKGILEVIERDAFMIVWQNRISPPRLNLRNLGDPFVKRLLQLIDGVPVDCHVLVLSLDIDVPVVMVVFTSTTGRPPFTVMGMGVDLEPNRAIALALEEAFLGYVGMNRSSEETADLKPEPDFKNVTSPIKHGYAHALWPELRKPMEFLLASENELSIQDLSRNSKKSFVANINTLVGLLREKDLEVIVKDLTTCDVDDAGFKVVRVIVPGMQPLDANHAHRYLGGKRLYEVPCQMGLFNSPLVEEDLNTYPHLFP